jgi:hypothetical protein
VNHLIISREYPPAAYTPGGIGAYVANIARLMADQGETVHVIGERWEGASLERETSAQIQSHDSAHPCEDRPESGIEPMGGEPSV